MGWSPSCPQHLLDKVHLQTSLSSLLLVTSDKLLSLSVSGSISGEPRTVPLPHAHPKSRGLFPLCPSPLPPPASPFCQMTLTCRLSLPRRRDTELRGLPGHPATVPAPQRRGLSSGGSHSPRQAKQHPGAAAPSPGTSLRGWCSSCHQLGRAHPGDGSRCLARAQPARATSSNTADTVGRESGRRLWPSSWGQPPQTPPPLPLGEAGGRVFVCDAHGASVPGWRPGRVSLSHSAPQREPRALRQARRSCRNESVRKGRPGARPAKLHTQPLQDTQGHSRCPLHKDWTRPQTLLSAGLQDPSLIDRAGTARLGLRGTEAPGLPGALAEAACGAPGPDAAAQSSSAAAAPS